MSQAHADASMKGALVIEALRSPRGRGSDKGSLKSLKPVELLAGQLQALGMVVGRERRQEFSVRP